MNLNSRPAQDPRWVNAADNTLDGFLSCTIELYAKDQIDDGQAYNWKTNTGAGGTNTLLFAGDAQLQVYRFTLTMDAPAGSVDQVRSVRFTIKGEDIEGVDVRRGQTIRVTSCDNDPTLERYQYIVNSGLNSGAAFRRTIETEVDLTRVIT